MRIDAERNHAEILRAAREVLATRGLDAPMAAIARHAAIGTATLYRRFRSRDALVAAVFETQLETCVRVADEILSDQDPERSFVTLVSRLCLLQAEDRAFTLALLRETRGVGGFDQARRRVEEAIRKVVGRAREAGVVRRDLRWTDVIMVIVANAGLVSTLTDNVDTIRVSRRLTGLLLDAFRPRPDNQGLPTPSESVSSRCDN